MSETRAQTVTAKQTVTVKQALAAARKHQEAGALSKARWICGQVLAMAPRYGPALHLMGLIAYQSGEAEEGLDFLDRAAAASLDNPTVKLNRGRMLRGLGRFEEAASLLRSLLASAPESEEVRDLLFEVRKDHGRQCQDDGRLDTAKLALEEALAIRPGDPEARFLQAGVLLLLGHLRDGFRHYESRWEVPGFPSSKQALPRPEWDGGDPAGKTILIYPEQGLGDSIQFCRYIPTLKARGARTVLAAGASLRRLFQTLEGLDQLIDLKQTLPPFDRHVPIMSLPHLCGTAGDSIPGAVPYLHPDPAAVAAWRRRFAGLPGKKVGLVWAGNPKHPKDEDRSIPLEALKPILAEPGITWISLQADGRRQDLSALGAAAPLDLGAAAPLDLGGDLTDFAETAAVVANLDAVVCVDTAIAHLTGAIGKRAFVLLAYRPDWRWLMERPDSPWYPTLRLVRQKEPGDWPSALERLAIALNNEL